MTPKTAAYRLTTFNAALSLILGVLYLLAIPEIFVASGLIGFPLFRTSLVLWTGILGVALCSESLLLKYLRGRPLAAFIWFSTTRAAVTATSAAALHTHLVTAPSWGPYALFAWVIFVALATSTLFDAARANRQLNAVAASVTYTVLGIIVIALAGSAVSGAYAVMFNSGGIQNAQSGKRADEQTTYDFQLMSQDIGTLADANHGSLPSGNAEQIARQGTYGKQFHIAARARNYVYTPLPADQHGFELCARFFTDTTGRYQGVLEPNHPDDHRAGYQCLAFSVP